jgi:hypothetical protein
MHVAKGAEAMEARLYVYCVYCLQLYIRIFLFSMAHTIAAAYTCTRAALLPVCVSHMTP